MGTPPPEPPVITLLEPIWDYLIYLYTITGILFYITVNQASQLFVYVNGILVWQTPSPIPPNIPHPVPIPIPVPFPVPPPAPVPYPVVIVLSNGNGSTQVIRNIIITPTPVTTPPVLQKINPTTVDLPAIPLNTTQPLSLIVSVDQWSTLTLKIDGVLYGTPQYVSEPNSPFTFVIGLDYLNNTLNIGEHTIAINAENSNGISDVALVYILNLVCPIDCLPSGNVINFQFNQFRIKVNGGWSSWMPAFCYENAIARFGLGSQDKSQFSSELSNIEWRRNDSGCQKCNVSFYNAVGPNQKLYLVSSSLNSHAMVAEFLGRADHFTEDRIVWNNWRFFQYSNQQITKNEPDPDINPPFIQMPQGSDGEYNWITIRQVTQININDTGGIRYHGVPVAQFTIDELNQVTPKNEPFQDIPLPD